MRYLISVPLVVAVFTGVSGVAQNPVGVQNQIFTVPRGWGQTAAGPGVILTPDAAANLVTIFLVGRPLGGQTLRAAFEQDLQGLSQGLLVTNKGPIQTRNANGVEVLSAAVELRDPKGISFYRNYVAAGPPGRIEMMVYTATSPQLFQRFLPDVTAFASSWWFANAGASTAGAPPSGGPVRAEEPAAGPAPRAGRFDAVYSALKIGSALRFGVATDTYTFLQDGTVCHCLPESGILGFNSAEQLRASPEFVGQYQIDGDRITIFLARGTYRRMGTFSTDRIVMEGRPYERRGDPGQIGLHPLDGVFVRADRTSTDRARRLIRFTGSGQFEDQGIVESVASSLIVNGTPVMERAAGAGTYQVSRYTLTLRYSDGYVRRLPITAEPADLSKPKLSSFSVNTYVLVSQ